MANREASTTPTFSSNDCSHFIASLLYETRSVRIFKFFKQIFVCYSE